MIERPQELKGIKIIGITGGIGSGKSTASRILRSLGYMVVDADKISRSITRESQRVIGEIKGRFGSEVFEDDGSLNRKILGSKVFSCEEDRLWLEKLLHKDILKEAFSQMKDFVHECELRNNHEKLIFFDVPLLYESGWDKICDRVIVVVASMKKRISRVMKRDAASRKEVLSRIEKQMSDEERLSKATEVIWNNEGEEQLRKGIQEILRIYEKI